MSDNTTELKQDSLSFRVSSALKDIIGRDLITNDFVAIFELVKNSFDAHATKVDLYFGDDTIMVVDDGKGMTATDIREKWLFVAYSAKKIGEEDISVPRDYRDKISIRRGYAGSKGIGRFSCDRLGAVLELYSRADATAPLIDHLSVNWAEFEENSKLEFAKVKVTLDAVKEVPPALGAEFTEFRGTALVIKILRSDWDRAKLLKLKEYLAKLVNPLGSQDSMAIHFHVPREEQKDQVQRLAAKIPEDVLSRFPDRSTALAHMPTHFFGIVNGPVSNFIFSVLESKTTKIEVRIADGTITSKLIDRGRLIYSIQEEPRLEYLRECRISMDIFYLNRSAKAAFTRAMGVESVNFGHIFLFLNGFRVFPIGESEDDTFGLNRRKQQGYARFLGTREVIGRVDISAPSNLFRETSSRDGGLIEGPETLELHEVFRRLGLQRLERYVVDVTWVDKLDADRLDTTGLTTDAARARIAMVVSHLAENTDVVLLEYDKDLVNTINERAKEFETSLKALSIVADRTNDPDLVARIEQARARHEALRRSEAAARQAAEAAREAAEAERQARLQAEARERAAAVRADVAVHRYEEEKKRSLFLTSLQAKDSDTLINLHHQVVIYATVIQDRIANMLTAIRAGRPPTADHLANELEQISFQNSRVLAVTRFATQANFRLDADRVNEDIVQYMRDYVLNVSTVWAGQNMLSFDDGGQQVKITFRPIDIGIIIDNLIANAQRAKATRVAFKCGRSQGGALEITVEDNGMGIDPLRVDKDRIFEKGYSTTRGSGLGLYHVAQVLSEIKGTIGIDDSFTGRGTRFIIRITRPKTTKAEEQS